MNKRNENMLELKQRGLSYAQIAFRYGITRQRVFQIVKRDKEKLTPHATQNLSKQPSDPQGRGLKGFCVGLVERIKERLFS